LLLFFFGGLLFFFDGFEFLLPVCSFPLDILDSDSGEGWMSQQIGFSLEKCIILLFLLHSLLIVASGGFQPFFDLLSIAVTGLENLELDFLHSIF
jgi:hypothetical protein